MSVYMGLWVLSSVLSGLLSAAPECLLPLSLEWCILLTAGHMKGFILKWLVWCAWMAAWYSFSCQKHLAGQMWKPHCHPDPIITWKGWFLTIQHFWAHYCPTHCVEFTLNFGGTQSRKGQNALIAVKKVMKSCLKWVHQCCQSIQTSSLQQWN